MEKSIGASVNGTLLKMLHYKGSTSFASSAGGETFVVAVITHRPNNCTVSKYHHLAA
jgi:hypothetical protein